ncbi:MAG: hypothetical protein A2521_04240 [Deltaproteobacteria bacterium RIFOXYD12_FULL_57_12]|nr:MAG: hypothetical protein A2521_04240 [Deltaproteobacteria bacterium RIFOXYD12_FULL_57_12]
MAAPSTHAQLTQLHSIILKERECARALDIGELQTVMQEKEELLRAMGPLRNLPARDLSLAREIQAENRRNAYLFWSALNWIRETMEFFGRQITPAVYSQTGGVVKTHAGGRLLSGKI